MRPRCVVALVLAVAAPRAGAAWEVDFLGPSREVSHASSASRDTAALGVQFLPRRVLSGGGDFGVFMLRGRGVSTRLGVFAMLELESEGTTNGFDWFPQADLAVWRGIYGYSIAVSADALARRWLGPRGALEATLNFRHESEHATASNDGDPGRDWSDRPHVGDFVMPDLAIRVGLGRVDLVGRVQHKFFVPTGGGYAQGPGGDLVVRWRRWRRLHPFASLFGEYAFGDGYPDAYLVRGLAGIAVPSRAGDIWLYGTADVGHRKGLAVFTEERTLGLGVRFTFFRDAP